MNRLQPRSPLCEECPETVLVFLSRHRIVGTTCVIVIAITLVFCSWRIYVTSRWLQSLRDYTVQRDVIWEPILRRSQESIDRNYAAVADIEAHMKAQDEMIRSTEDHIKRHDQLAQAVAKRLFPRLDIPDARPKHE